MIWFLWGQREDGFLWGHQENLRINGTTNEDLKRYMAHTTYEGRKDYQNQNSPNLKTL